MISFKGKADKQYITELLQDLVRIDSINPAYPGGSVGEINVVNYVAKWCEENGIEYQIMDALPGRPNLLAKLPGKTRDGIVMEAHTDTVSVEAMTIPPFDPVVKDGLLYGRGSCDTKSCLATMMYAMKLMKDNNIVPATDVYLAAAVDEELAYRGVVKLIESGFKAKFGIAGEATGCDIAVGCKGVVRFPLVCRGKSGHSSRPWEGHNAIHDMAEVLHAIKTELIPLYETKYTHPLLGYSTINVGVIQGGELINIIPEFCRVEIDVRTLPGQTFETVSADFEAVLDKLRAADPEFNCTIEEPLLLDYAMETPQDSDIVRAAVLASDDVRGDHVIKAVFYGCDGSKLDRAGTPCIVLGAGDIKQAHSAVEFVEVDQLVTVTEMYADICANLEI